MTADTWHKSDRLPKAVTLYLYARATIPIRSVQGFELRTSPFALPPSLRNFQQLGQNAEDGPKSLKSQFGQKYDINSARNR
jgi:hypothetical protein